MLGAPRGESGDEQAARGERGAEQGRGRICHSTAEPVPDTMPGEARAKNQCQTPCLERRGQAKRALPKTSLRSSTSGSASCRCTSTHESEYLHKCAALARIHQKSHGGGGLASQLLGQARVARAETRAVCLLPPSGSVRFPCTEPNGLRMDLENKWESWHTRNEAGFPLQLQTTPPARASRGLPVAVLARARAGGKACALQARDRRMVGLAEGAHSAHQQPAQLLPQAVARQAARSARVRRRAGLLPPRQVARARGGARMRTGCARGCAWGCAHVLEVAQHPRPDLARAARGEVALVREGAVRA